MHKSQLVEEWREEGRQEGRLEGRLETRREDLVDLAGEPLRGIARLVQQVQAVTDSARLKAAFRHALQISSLDQFQL